MDRTNPRKHLVEKEHKSKPKRPPRGAVTHKKSGMWKSVLTTRGVQVNLGYHKTREAAESAYWKAAKECDDLD